MKTEAAHHFQNANNLGLTRWGRGNRVITSQPRDDVFILKHFKAEDDAAATFPHILLWSCFCKPFSLTHNSKQNSCFSQRQMGKEKERRIPTRWIFSHFLPLFKIYISLMGCNLAALHWEGTGTDGEGAPGKYSSVAWIYNVSHKAVLEKCP